MKSLLNIIFLVTSIISCIKILSTKSISSAIIPFLMVIGIGLIMDLIEELKRYKNDLQTNNTISKVYKDNRFINIQWSEIKIGNLIKIKKDEIIPADLFVLCSSNKDGTFYLQTSNIDGESNLKQREILMDTQKIFYKNNTKEQNYLEKLFKVYNDEGEEKCYIEVDQPNKNIYDINGKIYFDSKNIFFDINNTAIRGAILKNTQFIYGIVIYTGNETKIMKNFIKSKNKYAYLDKLVDNIILVIIIIRIIYVLLFMTIGIYYRYKYIPNYEDNNLRYEYLFYYRHNDGIIDKNNNLENLKYFTSHFILSQTILPTSVAVLLTISKVIQSLFIEFLETSLRLKPNQKMKCFSSELLGELGSVKYIFSDKTGTLTKNQTQFKACSIFTSLFDESNENSQTETFINKTKSLSHSQSNFSLKFNTDNLLNRLKLRNTPLNLANIENCPFKSQGEVIEEFLLNMALNHDIMIDNFDKNKKINKTEEIKYQGTNPDEITLVGAAKELGFCFFGKVGNILKIKRILFSFDGKEEKNEIKKYQILLKIPFSSERQRSTIIVRDLATNKIKIYIKGSDTKIFEKINYYSKNNILEITKEHVDNFARRGLRTLCYCFKIIPENEYNKWSKSYNIAKESIDKNKLTNSLIEEIESNCYLLGATALEDQLQDNVKEDIQQFIDAGINFWMLTGDKMDTAESIGHSIKLFDSDTEVYKIKGTNEVEIIEEMGTIKKKIKKAQNDLSKITIDKEEIFKRKKLDFNTKFNIFKKKLKDRIEVIYEEEDEVKLLINNNNINQSENISEMRLKTNYIENGSDKIIVNDNKSLNIEIENINNINNIILNISKKASNKQKLKKKNELENMSILKFLVDNQYFENSNLELENLTLIKDKVEYPNLDDSFNNDKDKDSLYINKKNENQNYKSIQITYENGDFNNLKIWDNNENDKKTEKEKKNEQYKSQKSQKELNILKKEKRQKVNIPIEEEDFLNYFEKCVENLREIFYIQQKSFFLFKIPYLYGLIKEEKDPLTEDIKKRDWKQKLNLKNVLLHTKIQYSLIISGECIQYCISKGKASDLFWFLIQHSRSIICCRCSPKQKCDIVNFVKNHTNANTLAIGDGENDVNMIKTANVGIGIFGKEGSQAAFNSDYAFYEFKYLKTLLFINGRFTLLRNTYFMNMFFFKNYLYTFQGIIFTFYSLYSGIFFMMNFMIQCLIHLLVLYL